MPGRRSFHALALAALLVMGLGASARAGTLLFDFTYTGTGLDGSGGPAPAISASGTFTTTDTTDSGGAYTVIGISGQRNGDPITALLPFGSILGNTNRLLPGTPYLDFGGIGFVAGGVSFDLFLSAFSTGACAGVLEFIGSSSCSEQFPVVLTVTPTVPEPLSLAILGTGLAGLGLARRHRLRMSPAR